jgi:hypothetical protein
MRFAVLMAAATLLAALPLARGQGGKTEVGKKAPSGQPAGAKKHQKEKEKVVQIEGALTPDLPADPVRGPGHYHKVHLVPLVAGKTYTIRLLTREGVNPAPLDPYLRLEDPGGVFLAQDDDGDGFPNSRIVFECKKDGTYRVIATSFGPGQTGRYVIMIHPGVGPPGTVPGPSFVGVSPPPVPAPLPQPERSYGDVVVQLEPGPNSYAVGFSDNDYGHGYVEHRFTVRNRSTTETHRVTLRMPPRRIVNGVPGTFLSALSRTVDVAPGETATVALLQPDLAVPNGGVTVLIDGQEQREPVQVNLNQGRGSLFGGNYGSYGPGRDLLLRVLAVPRLAPRLQTNIFKSAVDAPPGPIRLSFRGGISGMYDGKHYTYSMNHRLEVGPPAADWPTDWLAYSGYDGVAVAAEDLQAAPPAVREALWRYAECGGSLVLVGKATVPDSWGQARADEEGFTCYYPGLGECLVSAVSVDAWTPSQWRRVTGSWEASGQPWRRVRTLTEANNDFPVQEDLGIPVRGLFVLMLVFAVGIGPVNLFVLSRRKRRIWMLWTVPAISLVTCLAVLGYMLVSEGWTGHARAQTLTVLDESARRASTVGWAGYYTPLAPSGGLHFSQQTELTPQLAAGSYRRWSSSPRSLDWTDEQHLASGWITARVPAYFAVRKSSTEHVRLALHRGKGGALEVVNLLGADVRRLWLADRDGTIYTASDVPAGGKATLTPAGKKAEGEPGSLRALYGKDWLQHYHMLTTRPEGYLRPGCYLATLDAAPFLEEGLRGAQPRESRSVVYGILKEGGDES